MASQLWHYYQYLASAMVLRTDILGVRGNKLSAYPSLSWRSKFLIMATRTSACIVHIARLSLSAAASDEPMKVGAG